MLSGKLSVLRSLSTGSPAGLLFHSYKRRLNVQSGPKCSFCGEFGHYETKTYDGSAMIQYYACEKFVEMNPLERFNNLRKLGFCYQCLFPGAVQNTGNHANGKCQRDFSCKHPSHDRYDMRKHVLVCYEHRNTEENKKILDTYKRKFILQRPGVPEFAKEIKLSFMSQQSHVSISKDSETLTTDDQIINENGIYMLQKVQIGRRGIRAPQILPITGGGGPVRARGRVIN